MRVTASDQGVQVLTGFALLRAIRDVRRDLLGMLLRTTQAAGDIAVFRLGSQTLAVINDADLAHAVLVEQAAAFEKAPNLTIAWQPVLGNGLLTCSNTFHRQERRLLAPAFHTQRIVTYAQTMARLADQVQGEWPDGAVIDVHTAMLQLTLAIVGQTLFAADLLAEANELGQEIGTVMREVERQFQRYGGLVNTGQVPHSRRFGRAVARLDALVTSLIAAHRQPSDADAAADVTEGDTPQDLLTLLLYARYTDGTPMAEQQIRDEVMTMFLAGHETTANALTWAWYLLAQHPEAEARLHGEVDCVLDGRVPTAGDLAQLPYTLRVLKETLRLYPPAHLLLRQVVQPIELGGYTLTAGSLVVVSPYTLHRRPDYFPEPERFDPDRFTSERERALPRFAYLPFGGGPRTCIGNQFALMEGHIMLATLARQVKFALAERRPVQPEPLITLRPKHGVRMTVQRRAIDNSGASAAETGEAQP